VHVRPSRAVVAPPGPAPAPRAPGGPAGALHRREGRHRHRLRPAAVSVQPPAPRRHTQPAPRPHRRGAPGCQPAHEDDNAQEQRTTGERRQRAGGLPVLMVDPRAGLIELRLSRGAHSTTLRGPGYLDFINECSFTVDDVVRIWAFNHRASPSNVEESPLYLVIAKKPTPQT
uniref:Uncharacterized protein n=1 Tax=Aegilops tauschii subsp. strangulata TaxID=200361 RepID=A0A453CPM2_AEGTS